MFISKHLILTSKFTRLLSSSSSSPLSPSIQSLIKSGLTPTQQSINQHLLYLSLNGRFNSAVNFFAQIAANNHSQPETTSILATLFLECNDVKQLARFLNAQMEKIEPLPKSRIWDCLIRVLCDRDSDRALCLLKELLRSYATVTGSGMKLKLMPLSWSFGKLILCLCGRGELSRAVEVLELMTDENVGVGYTFDNFVISCVRASFCNIGKAELGVEFFHKAESPGNLRPNLAAYTALVNAYCLLGRVDDVSDLLSKMESEGVVFDVVFYTRWIVGCCRQGFLQATVSKYGEMLESGDEPDEVCYSILLDGLGNGGNVAKAVGILNEMKKDGVDVEPNLRTFTSIISAFCKNGKFDEALSVFKIVKALGIAVDEVAAVTLIDEGCKLGKFDDAFQVLTELRKSSFTSVECYQCIILGLCRNGMVEAATNIFIELNEQGIALDIDTYIALVKAVLKDTGATGVLNFIHTIETLPQALFGTICNEAIILLHKSGFTDTAFDLYIMMVSKGLVASSRVFYLILRDLITDGEHPVIQILLSKFVKHYGLTDYLVAKTLVHFLCMKDGDAAVRLLQSVQDEVRVILPTSALKKLAQNGKALNVYSLVKAAENKLPIKDVVDSSILVDALCKEGLIDVALDLCRFVKKRGISHNVETYNSILHALCRQGCHMEAFRLFDSFERLKLVPTVVTYSILIDALCKEGYLVKAEGLLERMVLHRVMPNVRTFNSLLDGYCKFGYFEKALALHHDIQNKGLKPDQFTISAMINGFYLKGDMQGALDFYIDSKRKGESPDFLGFLYLIRGLLTKGRMEEARGVMKEMLQTKSVRDSINQVDAEVDTESIGNFLVDLCDQGSMKEAVTILDEVGCVLFPLSIASTHKKKYSLSTMSKDNVGIAVSSLNNLGNDSLTLGFNHFYRAIASLCLEGELQNANSLVKQMLQRFSGVEDMSTEYKVV